MGLVKEPKGVDLTVVQREMTPEEKRNLSDFISKRKKEIKQKVRKRTGSFKHSGKNSNVTE